MTLIVQSDEVTYRSLGNDTLRLNDDRLNLVLELYAAWAIPFLVLLDPPNAV